jgi:hypothetical protein
MPRVGFEPMTSVIQRAKTVDALDRAATVICCMCVTPTKYKLAQLCRLLGLLHVDPKLDDLKGLCDGVGHWNSAFWGHCPSFGIIVSETGSVSFVR